MFQLITLASVVVGAGAIDAHVGATFLTPVGLEKPKASPVAVLHVDATVESSVLHVGSVDSSVRHVGLHHVVSYNRETPVVIRGHQLGITVEGILAGVFVCMIASVPLAIALLEDKPSKTHIVQSGTLLVWLVSCLYLFTHVVYFESIHFSGQRPLTLVETIYLMAQVLTTVGHGDINPATPNAQVIVALYVFFTIVLIADMVSAVVHLAITRTNDYTKKLTQFYLDRQAQVAKRTQLVDKDLALDVELLRRGKPPLPWIKFFTMWAAFLFLVSIGVLFYHFFPGENKSWLEGIYMSVITLTTVGFGSVLPSTEAGKVFSAFWMLFGVVSLLSVVSGCTELILAFKAREQWTEEDHHLELDKLRKRAVKSADSGLLLVSKVEFLRFAILQTKMLGRDELDKIDRTFQAFQPDHDGYVSFEAIERATLPFDGHVALKGSQ